MKEVGEEYQSSRQLFNGEWVDVTMRVVEIKEHDDNSKEAIAELTEESEMLINEKLEELGYPSPEDE